MVTVLLPVYNGEKYLSEAIESILNQTFTNFEFLIINDGSADRTEEIILGYTDPRINYVKNEQNIKLIATLNKGLALAKGKYIVRFDADDIAMPNRIEKQVAFMESNPDIGICGSGVYSMIDDRVVIYPETDEQIRLRMLMANPFSHPTMIIRREVIEQSGLKFEPQYLHIEDYAFWYHMSQHCKTHNLPEPLIKYRVHENQVSSQYQEIQREQDKVVRAEIFSGLINKDKITPELYHFYSFQPVRLIDADEFEKLAYAINNLVSLKKDYYNDAIETYTIKRFWDYCCVNTKNGTMVSAAWSRFESRVNTGISLFTRLKFKLKCLAKI